MASQHRKHRGGLRLPPPINRLRASVTQMPNGCLVRTTNLNQQGYSRMTVGGRQVLCHRLAWEHEHGPIPVGMKVLHRCDNPPCVNAAHLFLGTTADNNRDMWAKGRAVLTPPRWRKVRPDCYPDIAARLARGVPRAVIARRYGVTPQAISHIARTHINQEATS